MNISNAYIYTVQPYNLQVKPYKIDIVDASFNKLLKTGPLLEGFKHRDILNILVNPVYDLTFNMQYAAKIDLLTTDKSILCCVTNHFTALCTTQPLFESESNHILSKTTLQITILVLFSTMCIVSSIVFLINGM